MEWLITRQRISKKAAQKKVKESTPAGTKYKEVKDPGKSGYRVNERTVAAPRDPRFISHEAAHARQHGVLGDLVTAPIAASNVGPLVASGLQALRGIATHRRLRKISRIAGPHKLSSLEQMPTYLPTAVAALSQVPQLVTESHANLSVLKEKDALETIVPSMGSYVVGSIKQTAPTAIVDVLRHRAIRKLRKRGVPMGKYSLKYAAQDPIERTRRLLTGQPETDIGEFLDKNMKKVHVVPLNSLADVPSHAHLPPLQQNLNATFDAASYPRNANPTLARRALSKLRRLPRGIGKSALEIGKGAGRGAADYTTFLLLKQILDSISGSNMGKHIPDIKSDVEMMPTYSLQQIHYQLNNFSAKTAEGKRRTAYYCGIVAGELEGRKLDYVAPIVAGAARAAPAAIRFGTGLFAKIRGAGASIKSGIGAGKNTLRTVGVKGRKMWRKHGWIPSAGVGGLFAADAVSSIRNQSHAHRQMKDWDAAMKRGTPSRPPAAWDNYQLQYGAGHRALARKMLADTSRPMVKGFPKGMFAHVRNQLIPLRNKVARKELTSEGYLNNMREVRRRLSAESRSIGGIVDQARKKAKQRGLVQGTKLARDKIWNMEIATESAVNKAKALHDKYTPFMKSMKRQNKKLRKHRDHAQRVALKASEHATSIKPVLQMPIRPKPQVVHVPAPRKPLSNLAKTAITGGAVAGVGGGSYVGIEAGRRLGKHEERQRLRKLADMETV